MRDYEREDMDELNMELVARKALEDLRIRDASASVEEDVVRLRGNVSCYEKKREAARRIVDLLPNASLVNEIRVLRDVMDDPTIRREVEVALQRFGEDVSRRVQIEVNAGVVRLRGSARDAAERNAIEAAVWESCGVHRVDNALLTASDDLSEAEIEAHLNEYVLATFRLPPGLVTVGYESGRVTLSGRASSIAGRNAIEELVRWHDRVDDVVNDLQVVNQPLAMRSVE